MALTINHDQEDQHERMMIGGASYGLSLVVWSVYKMHAWVLEYPLEY